MQPIPQLVHSVCAWCEDQIAVRQGGEASTTSHGLCDECKAQLVASLAAARGERRMRPWHAGAKPTRRPRLGSRVAAR